MSEITFAKQFLTQLDKRAIKLPADHVSDPRQYPAQSPYILPRQTHPFPRKTVSQAAQQAKQKSVTATLKPMRGGETITVPGLTLESTIHDVKTQYAEKSGQPQDKIKLLLNKKPAADLKTLKDLGVDGEAVDLSVMVMGGAASTPGATSPAVSSPATEKPAPVPKEAEPADKMEIDEKAPAPESEKAQAEAEKKEDPNSTAGILGSEEFWDDLEGYLSQRIRDEAEAGKLTKIFREAHGKR
ncbi:Get5 carboxyl domain [Teratosphaeria destructans]|uniref:Get5 carboxyl domain n=1 Tax=Teratosphaeria destructans TaxID=418781 RepID=A0A9W7W006_9PEZI|nr:Get5 carboxyl domain [Teratosphaeria destructans]